jgi:hypothetical protein
MSAQTEKTQADRPNNGALFTLAAAGAASLVAIYLGVTALVRHQQTVIHAERSNGADHDVRELRAGWEKQQVAAPHRDLKKGTIALPIDLAMGAVVKDLQRDPRTATAFMPADAGADAAAVEADAGAASDDAGAEPAPTEGAAPEGQPAPEAPAPEAPAPEPAPGPEKKEAPKKKPKPTGPIMGGAVAPQPAAPAPAPAPKEESPY